MCKKVRRKPNIFENIVAYSTKQLNSSIIPIIKAAKLKLKCTKQCSPTKRRTRNGEGSGIAVVIEGRAEIRRELAFRDLPVIRLDVPSM